MLTKSQRKKVYKYAINRIIKRGKELTYCCTSLTEGSIRLYQYCDDDSKNAFPEFYLFEPDNPQFIVEWWPDYDQQPRLIALELCILMCE